ncbi:menaquinone biosynthetic enzyme MqnA/MqnD family protein [Lacipirellula parvula]|uniref:Chorismate dehydratase n=1 Tax=Lacipirellula parvula TaxID=2650471 RepID=A0A5K7XAB6_9BACT|nr:menaquinone biosynthesis protein [Lacipirellula parvula]BBO33488.1 chorismate dehydratase [Lacipirellula parvula]
MSSAAPDPTAPATRIGAVTYLNTVPLVRGLQAQLPMAELSFNYPSRLADELAEGRLDVALAPCIEVARHPEWSIVSTACIGCRGPVLSVKVLFRRPPAEVRTLALDEGSRTSAVLAQILLADRFGTRPRLQPLPLASSPLDSTADAVLVIGDRAIRPVQGDFREAWDLGEEWVRETGLPFVFAVWAARPGIDASELEPAFDAARDLGLRELETIATEQAAAMDLPRPLVLQYLRDNLNFYLDDSARRGLDLYFRRAGELGLISDHFNLRFHDCHVER